MSKFDKIKAGLKNFAKRVMGVELSNAQAELFASAEQIGKTQAKESRRQQRIVGYDQMACAANGRPPSSWFTKRRTEGVRRSYRRVLGMMPTERRKACIAKYGAP